MRDPLQSTNVAGGQDPFRRQLVLPHPDADQLNAFVELSLPEHERLETLKHLAECSECRQIVALSLPPQEAEVSSATQPEAAPAQTRPTPGRLTGWFTGWRLVWVAGPALAALLLLSVHLRSVLSGPHPATKAGQVADARLLAPPPHSVPPSPAPVTPPANAPAAAPTAPNPPIPQVPSAALKASPTPAPPPSTGEQSRPEAGASGRALDSMKQQLQRSTSSPPAARTLARNMQPVEPAAGHAQISQGSALRRNNSSLSPEQAAVRPAAPTSTTPTTSRELLGSATRISNQPAFSVRDAVPASKSASISQQTLGGAVMSETVQVAASSAAASGAAVASRESTNSDAALKRPVQASNPAPLPSGLPVLSLATNRRQRIALDSRNQLFFSDDEGQHWRRISAPWRGHPVTVANILPAPIGSMGTANSMRTINSTAQPSALALAVPERYTPGAGAAVQPGEGGATLSGAITDMTGATIPGATVVATESRTAFTRSAQTDAQGHYLLTNLPPGVYRLDAHSAGFIRQSQVAVLGAAQQSVNNIRLAIGQTAETVTVQAAPSPELETSHGVFGSLMGKARESASSPADKPASANKLPPLFLLTTDNGERWTSPDGIAWARQ